MKMRHGAHSDEPTRARGLEIREAQRGDLEAMVRLERAARPDPFSRDLLAREFGIGVSYQWVARSEGDGDGSLAGLLVFWIVGGEAQIHDLAVAPARRREGIATALVTHLVEFATAEGARVVTLEVRQNNRAAIALYESLDFEIIGRREAYYSDTGEAALLMTRRL